MSADKDYLSLPLRTFVADLAAKRPTPGGGSVAAMAGLLAAAQARMVVEYTVGKPKFAAYEKKLREALGELERAEAAFAELMSEDMAAYERLAASCKAGDPAEQQQAVATATAVPMEITAMAGAVLALLDGLKECVNPYLLGDLKVAAIMSLAAAQSAAVNVEVNLRDLADGSEVERVNKEMTRILEKAYDHRNSVLNQRAS
ncbi:MAG TPA: cyclodeaminase/cyclohydrolase family protein [Phycisphaerae bacterium]|nr:cyclodeaminase/cyclohydrolase family protein [Phycisphaerae bacterium]HRR84405.1 cyclodeaminase/cyclohydrolase family protein [Phycisphaerae bacterium]